MSRSPFTPGYGVQPLVFGGHVEELAAFRRAFEDYDFGDRRSILLSGLRGTGKTSMLLELQAMAEEDAALAERIKAAQDPKQSGDRAYGHLG